MFHRVNFAIVASKRQSVKTSRYLGALYIIREVWSGCSPKCSAHRIQGHAWMLVPIPIMMLLCSFVRPLSWALWIDLVRWFSQVANLIVRVVGLPLTVLPLTFALDTNLQILDLLLQVLYRTILLTMMQMHRGVWHRPFPLRWPLIWVKSRSMYIL